MAKWPNLNMEIQEIKKYKRLIKRIQNWILKNIKKANATGITLGISGGIDSATLAAICYDLLKENAHFYYLKTKVDNENEKDIKQLNKLLNYSIEKIDLGKEFDSFSKKFTLKNDWVKANAKSRFFMTALYTKAQQTNSLVLGTDNFNEYYLGYFTKWGDGGVDLLPFANLLKSDIYKMAKILSVPESILNKKPSANLLDNQYDEDELGFNYASFEEFIKGNSAVNKEILNKIKEFHIKTEHKRKLIPKGPKNY
ncbi:NH(3)-dependent NAD(+) synthetase [Metamycoplasma auris 15026]|uniref:NH(3)-dependent NAD(+) synthetase n=1 Tax=Metamycoplasma auris 15026 TaxID=1188233 RepID=N9VBD5_9BACT|nr:NAD(+) synthase [Metamycoplasma auris]ENY68686.1 NH(3)-dependent NAD(+) synthetase [Metamycoplasma auris 15026]